MHCREVCVVDLAHPRALHDQRSNSRSCGENAEGHATGTHGQERHQPADPMWRERRINPREHGQPEKRPAGSESGNRRAVGSHPDPTLESISAQLERSSAPAMCCRKRQWSAPSKPARAPTFCSLLYGDACQHQATALWHRTHCGVLSPPGSSFPGAPSDARVFSGKWHELYGK
jgi:hypothetical protein